jgi:CheY-like chemotaxis protein
MKKVLLVEDNPDVIKATRAALERAGFEITVQDTLPEQLTGDEFLILLDNCEQFAAIIMDEEMRPTGHETGIVLSTNGYIQAFRRIFKRPIIAFADTPGDRRLQMKMGCTENTGGKDPEVVAKVLQELLG